MAYTPVTTWAPGDLLEAELLDDDIRGIQDYLQKLPTNVMLAATPWVDTNHIMKGFYNPTLNQATFVSGVYGGQVYSAGAESLTYSTMYNTLRQSTNPQTTVVPKTAMSFELTSDCTILFHYWMCPITRDNKDLTLTDYMDIFIWGGAGLSAPLTSTRCRSLEEDTVTAATAEQESRRFCAGARLFGSLSSGTYSIGLAAQGTAPKTQIVAWGISAQLFAM